MNFGWAGQAVDDGFVSKVRRPSVRSRHAKTLLPSCYNLVYLYTS